MRYLTDVLHTLRGSCRLPLTGKSGWRGRVRPCWWRPGRCLHRESGAHPILSPWGGHVGGRNGGMGTLRARWDGVRLGPSPWEHVFRARSGQVWAGETPSLTLPSLPGLPSVCKGCRGPLPRRHPAWGAQNWGFPGRRARQEGRAWPGWGRSRVQVSGRCLWPPCLDPRGEFGHAGHDSQLEMH